MLLQHMLLQTFSAGHCKALIQYNNTILSHLFTNNLISPYQFGFMPGRSCSTQLLQVLDYLTQHLDNGWLLC